MAGADSATLLIAAATSYKNYRDVSGDPQALVEKTLRAASKMDFAALRRRHVAAHQRLFRRVSLDLGTTAAAGLPTDERIANFPAADDPALAALYFQFGRYLLISCSRPGGQPANLQGLWNESMTPPWESKYTININTEMNYWPADSCNLGECLEPLTSMVLDLTQTGARTARVMYGAGGWVAHHNTDLWRATGPVDGPKSGMWPTGGAWLCQNLWEHYLFTGDKKYLARIYPAIKGAAQFFLDTLVAEPTHSWLVTCPSLSPENNHSGKTSLCAGPSMDLEILRDLFSNCVAASANSGPRRRFPRPRGRRPRAPGPVANRPRRPVAGMAAGLGHGRPPKSIIATSPTSTRFFPATRSTCATTPELAAAARKSLEIRGDQATGWATAWRMNLWARLHDGDHAFTSSSSCSVPRAPIPTCSTPIRRFRSTAISAATSAHRRNAAAEPGRRNRIASGPAQGLARRFGAAACAPAAASRWTFHGRTAI